MASVEAEKHLTIGALEAEFGNYDTALENYDKAAALDPGNKTAYMLRAGIKYLLRDVAGALLDYDKAIALDERYADAYVGRGNILLVLGEQQAALSDFDFAISLQPQMSAAHAGRGLALVQTGNRFSGCLSLEKSRALVDARPGMEVSETDIRAVSPAENQAAQRAWIQGVITKICK